MVRCLSSQTGTQNVKIGNIRQLEESHMIKIDVRNNFDLNLIADEVFVANFVGYCREGYGTGFTVKCFMKLPGKCL